MSIKELFTDNGYNININNIYLQSITTNSNIIRVDNSQTITPSLDSLCNNCIIYQNYTTSPSTITINLPTATQLNNYFLNNKNIPLTKNIVFTFLVIFSSQTPSSITSTFNMLNLGSGTIFSDDSNASTIYLVGAFANNAYIPSLLIRSKYIIIYSRVNGVWTVYYA